MSYGTGGAPGGPHQHWPDQSWNGQHWAEYDDNGSGSGSSAGVIALIAFLTVLVLALLGVVAYLFLRPGGLSGEPADPVPGAAETSSSSSPTTRTTPRATTEATPTTTSERTSEPTTVTVTRTQEETRDPGTAYPAGADRSGWMSNSQARCNAGDPAAMIGRTDQASFSICVNPDNGRYYYRGSAGGSGVEVDDPVVSGRTASVTNNGVLYSISPDGMTIFENGAVISDQQMRQFWTR